MCTVPREAGQVFEPEAGGSKIKRCRALDISCSDVRPPPRSAHQQFRPCLPKSSCRIEGVSPGWVFQHGQNYLVMPIEPSCMQLSRQRSTKGNCRTVGGGAAPGTTRGSIPGRAQRHPRFQLPLTRIGNNIATQPTPDTPVQGEDINRRLPVEWCCPMLKSGCLV